MENVHSFAELSAMHLAVGEYNEGGVFLRKVGVTY
jgi:hypothetical protein